MTQEEQKALFARFGLEEDPTVHDLFNAIMRKLVEIEDRLPDLAPKPLSDEQVWTLIGRKP